MADLCQFIPAFLFGTPPGARVLWVDRRGGLRVGLGVDSKIGRYTFSTLLYKVGLMSTKDRVVLQLTVKQGR